MPLSKLNNPIYWLWRNIKEQSKVFPKMSDLSNLADTARIRHIQWLHESGDCRNPDNLAGELMTSKVRKECFKLNSEAIAKMRKNPYYYYLVARTKFYDQLLLNAVATGVHRILILGAGFDTRLYRFGEQLAKRGIEVAECDQPDAVEIKQKLAKQLPYSERVRYLSIDLNNQNSWNGLMDWLDTENTCTTLIFAEGVSPYVDSSKFLSFLANIASQISSDSLLAYDFKRVGARDDFGVTEDVRSPFRLPLNKELIKEKHTSLGFTQVSFISSLELMQTYIPSWDKELSPLFDEDALLKISR
ncbi:class I SAM-dependent methyltransferase [Methylomonas koyamae]|uniref:class I SAM-dependent methyltransferase n=1 Tax=Methylomonas koyamae TaxID=702114 RepID=UPI000A90C5C8|nr:class I SAM-dependent methyltransferase [Methylomonas koyamae]